jgi:allantoicase
MSPNRISPPIPVTKMAAIKMMIGIKIDTAMFGSRFPWRASVKIRFSLFSSSFIF